MNKVLPLDLTSGYPRSPGPLPPSVSEGDDVITIQRVLRAVRRRLVLMAAVFVVTFAGVAMFTFQLEPVYSATSRVIVNTRDQNIIDISAVLSGMPSNAAAVDTEAQILRSRILVEKLVRRLDLVNDGEFNWRKAEPSETDKRIAAVKDFVKSLVPFGSDQPVEEAPVDPAEAARAEMDDVVGSVRNAISVNRLGSTFIIEISARSKDPKKAARIANALAEVYLDNQLDTKYEATRRAQAWLNERIEELREEVQTAESAVEAHRAATGLLRPGGDQTLVEQAIRDLNANLIVAQAEYSEKTARLRNLNGQMQAGAGIDSIAEAQRSQAIQALRTKQADIAVRKAAAEERYEPRHPEYQRVQVEAADVQRQIDAELRRISSSLEQEVLIAREKVNTIQTSLNRAKGELAANSRAGVQQAALEREATASRTLFEEFNNRFKETDHLNDITDPDAVIDSYAPVPWAPSFPNTNLNLMLGVMLGLALAGFAGLVVELLDNYLSSPEDVEQVAGVPYIGQIPLLPAAGITKGRVKPADHLIEKPHSSFAEAYRHLRASIMFADIDKAAKTVAVVSSLPSEGKTSMTYCLGRMAAMSGTKTIVIDGDIRLRQLTEVSGLKPEAGLLEYLFGEARLGDVVVTDEKTGLHILPLTDRKNTPRDVFGSRAFDALLSLLQETYDLVIIDTGPILLMAETRVVTSKVDQVVVAARWRKTHRGTLRETMKILRDFHANITGVVLTFVDLRKRAHHAYTSANYKAYAKYYHDQ